MQYGNIGDASNNNHKQLHHLIGLSDPKVVIVYYNLVLLQMYELLCFGITGTGCTKQLKSVTDFYSYDLLNFVCINFHLKQTILIFCTEFAQKECSASKTGQMDITIEFCIL